MSLPASVARRLAALEDHLRRIQAERMADVPLLNGRLAVQATAFQPHGGDWLGVMITPWFIGLVLLPAREGAWDGLPPGRRRHALPAGDYAFELVEVEGVGRYQHCSLLSPVQELADQAAALAFARAARAALQESPAAGPGVSRRDFLRGRLGERRGETP